MNKSFAFELGQLVKQAGLEARRKPTAQPNSLRTLLDMFRAGMTTGSASSLGKPTFSLQGSAPNEHLMKLLDGATTGLERGAMRAGHFVGRHPLASMLGAGGIAAGGAALLSRRRRNNEPEEE